MRHTVHVLPILLAFSLSSCGSPPETRLPVYPVKGTALFKGQPAEGALVVLNPTGGQTSETIHPSGTVQTDGTFQVTTYETNDGAPEGSYTVTVFWPEPPISPIDAPDSGPDRLGGRYLDPQTSPWKIEVAPEPNTLVPLELK